VSDCISFTLSGITDLEEYDVVLYPNPTTGKVMITSSIKPKAVRVVDISGKAVDMTLFNSSFDIQSFMSGIYIVRIEIGEQVVYKKIVKE
jgi:hypothetical protein